MLEYKNPTPADYCTCINCSTDICGPKKNKNKNKNKNKLGNLKEPNKAVGIQNRLFDHPSEVTRDKRNSGELFT